MERDVGAMTLCQELEELIPAYALDAVDEKDRARIEAHLARCANCARLVAAYRPVVELLPYAVPQVEPPAELKYRVLAAVLPQAKPQPTPTPSFRSPLSSFLSTLFRAPAFAAVALVLLVALGVWNASLQVQMSQQAATSQKLIAELTRQREFMAVVAYADGTPQHLQGTQVAERAAGRLYGSPAETTLALFVDDLPALALGKVYQVWLIDPNGDRTSGGTFTVDERGNGWLLIHSPKPLKEYQGIGITVEPMGGSPKPTGPKMMGTSL